MIDSLEKRAKSKAVDKDVVVKLSTLQKRRTTIWKRNQQIKYLKKRIEKLEAVAKAARGVGCLCFVISQAQNCSLPPGFPQIHLQHCPADELKESLVALHEGEK